MKYTPENVEVQQGQRLNYTLSFEGDEIFTILLWPTYIGFPIVHSSLKER